MKQRAVIVFGNSVFKNDSAFEEIGKTIIELAKRLELVLYYDHNFCPENSFPIAIKNAFLKIGKDQKIASIDSKLVVDRRSISSRTPLSFIGPSLTYREYLRLVKNDRNIVIEKDKNGNLRRMVPLLNPTDIVEKREISDLLTTGSIVIISGESIVYKTKILKLLKFTNAVVDRDMAAEKLAEILLADYFISVTNIDNVCLNFGTENEIRLNRLTAKEIENYSKMGQFPLENIGKKLEACSKFAEKKKTSIICSVSNLELATKKQSGTIVE